MELLQSPAAWAALATLTILEIVLGIDNIVFISILSGKLPPADQPRARKMGLVIAMVMRVVMLLGIGLILSMTTPLFTLTFMGADPATGKPYGDITAKDLVLIVGGLFLVYKATKEIHDKLEGEEGAISAKVLPTFGAVMGQMAILNVVFSIDSVVTAIGMADHISIMVAAVLISSLFMIWFARPVSSFVEAHPTVKMLALSFLVLIGVNLIAEGFHQHIPKGYTYFAMAFSVAVEMLNLRLRKSHAPVHLHQAVVEDMPSRAS